MKVSEILKRENNNLDLIRVFLAALVIYAHSPTLNKTTSGWTDVINYFFNYTYSGSWAVKLFFFISGLVVTNSYLHKKSHIYFIISRAFRVVPLLFVVYFFTAFIAGPILTSFGLKAYFSNSQVYSYFFDNLVFNTKYSLPGVFENNADRGSVNGSIWSLRYEMACYIIVLIVFLFLGKKNKLWLNIPILFFLIDAFFPEGLMRMYLGENMHINVLPFSFALGALFAVNSDIIKINIWVFISSAVLVFLLRNTVKAELFLITSSSIFTLYLSTRAFFLKLQPKHDLSYGIYVWGFLVQQTVFFYFGHMNTALHCIISIIISFILSYVTYIYVEKPYIKKGKDLFKYYRSKNQIY